MGKLSNGDVVYAKGSVESGLVVDWFQTRNRYRLSGSDAVLKHSIESVDEDLLEIKI